MEHISTALPDVQQTQSEQPVSIETTFQCPICQDTGVLHPRDPLTDRVLYGQVVDCDCQKARGEHEKRQRLGKLCKLPAGTEGLTFEKFDLHHVDVQTAYNAALRLAEGDDGIRWLTLVSGPDRGKTHLAVAICRRWMERGRPARYVFVPLLLDQLRQGYNADQQRQQSESWWELAYERQMQVLMAIELLVLDDLGAQVPTPWAMEKLTTLIDHRCVNGLPLVITTNKALNALPGDDEGRIESRIKRTQGSVVVSIKSPEYRTVKAGEAGATA